MPKPTLPKPTLPKPMVRCARALMLVAGVGLLASPLLHAAPPPRERQPADIAALIQELNYLIEHAEGLAARYRRDAAPVQFNYAALLEQLRLTRDHSARYLNEIQTVVHPSPPVPMGSSLTRRH